MARILILGGGFSGLTAAEKLADALGAEHHMTLVSQNAEFIFYPALTHVAFGNLQPDDIKFDLRSRLSDLEVRFVQGEVLYIDDQHQTVKVYGDDFSGDLHYDYLIIATGRRLATEKIGGFFEYAHHLLGIPAALKFKKAIADFKRGQIVVGLCPGARLPAPVCETAYALAEKFASQITEGQVAVRVVFPGTVEEAFGGAALHREVEAAFAARAIEVVSEFPVDDISEAHVSARGIPLKYDLLMLLPSFREQAMLSRLNQSADDAGYAEANQLLQVKNVAHTYAAGDIAAFPGPKFASTALRQAETAAANIISEIAGEKPRAAYIHNIAEFIDKGGADSIYLHYGIWNESTYRLKTGTLSNWAKYIHERFRHLSAQK